MPDRRFLQDLHIILALKQACQLWDAADYRHCSQEKAALALEHSFALAGAFAPEPLGEEDAPEAEWPARRLIGLARAVSDGAYAALITDVVVHPDFRRRGIGRKLMALLRKQCMAQGATGCLVFAPKERMFFWKCGFRLGSRYKIMGLLREEQS